MGKLQKQNMLPDRTGEQGHKQAPGAFYSVPGACFHMCRVYPGQWEENLEEPSENRGKSALFLSNLILELEADFR